LLLETSAVEMLPQDLLALLPLVTPLSLRARVDRASVAQVAQ
jgi:hypothetical protein